MFTMVLSSILAELSIKTRIRCPPKNSPDRYCLLPSPKNCLTLLPSCSKALACKRRTSCSSASMSERNLATSSSVAMLLFSNAANSCRKVSICSMIWRASPCASTTSKSTSDRVLRILTKPNSPSSTSSRSKFISAISSRLVSSGEIVLE